MSKGTGQSYRITVRLDSEAAELLDLYMAHLEVAAGKPVGRSEAMRSLIRRSAAMSRGDDAWQAGYDDGFGEGRREAYAEHKRELAEGA